MYKSIIKIGIAILILSVFYSCAGYNKINSSIVKNRMLYQKEKIGKNRQNISKLKNQRIGSSGFYYIVDLNGLVVYHPEGFLIGSNFKKYWFVDKIIKEKMGCFRYFFGRIEHLIFFEPLNDREILCMSILASDFDNSMLNCRLIKKLVQTGSPTGKHR